MDTSGNKIRVKLTNYWTGDCRVYEGKDIADALSQFLGDIDITLEVIGK